MQLNFQERLELNSALVAVFDEKFDETTLKTIIGYCRNLNNYIGEVSFLSKDKNDSHRVSGYTAQSGNQEVDLDTKNNPSWRIGGKELRIGDFKITRTNKTLSFRRFWASDTTTSTDEDPPLTYEIRYAKNSFAPIFLAKIGTRIAFKIDNTMLLFLLQTQHRSIMWGNKKMEGSFVGTLITLSTYSWQGRLIVAFFLWVALSIFFIGAVFLGSLLVHLLL